MLTYSTPGYLPQRNKMGCHPETRTKRWMNKQHYPTQHHTPTSQQLLTQGLGSHYSKAVERNQSQKRCPHAMIPFLRCCRAGKADLRWEKPEQWCLWLVCWRVTGQRPKGAFWGDRNMLDTTWVSFVKTHGIVHLGLVQFTVYTFNLLKNKQTNIQL